MIRYNEIDFTQLNPDEFTELCADILRSTPGFNNIIIGGKGPDSGCDIFADEELVTHSGYSETIRWVVQCKHYIRSGKNVSATEIGDVFGYL